MMKATKQQNAMNDIKKHTSLKKIEKKKHILLDLIDTESNIQRSGSVAQW